MPETIDLPPIAVSLTPEVLNRISAVVPPGTSAYRSLMALITVGLETSEADPSALLRALGYDDNPPSFESI